jgi:histone H3/H4
MSINQLNLPNTTIQRLLKAGLKSAGAPDVQIAPEARAAINKAAALFALYVFNGACDEAKRGKKKRSTLNTADVLSTVRLLDAPVLVDIVEQRAIDLDAAEEDRKKKRLEAKAQAPISEAAPKDGLKRKRGRPSNAEKSKTSDEPAEEEEEEEDVNPLSS